MQQKNKRWAQSVELSKKDKLYKDALETAAESRDQAVAEDLLKFFVDNTNHSAFAATLYTCYDLIRPDVALELSWRNKIIDFAFPYIIQYVRDLNTRVEALEQVGKKEEVVDKKKEKAPEGFQNPPDVAGLDGVGGIGMMGYAPYYGGMQQTAAPLAIMPPPGSMPYGVGAYPGADYGSMGAGGAGGFQQGYADSHFGYPGGAGGGYGM